MLDPFGWHRRALCRDHPEVEFVHDRMGRADYGEALAICASCPVRAECLADALAFESLAQVGVRGGYTPRERARLPRTSYRRLRATS